MKQPTVAIVRGKFLNRYEMQSFEPLVKRYQITAFGSLRPIHDHFGFPVVKLPSPMDLPGFPYKMQILNRLFIDAHYLLGLEQKLRGFDLVHTAETYYRYTQQALHARKQGLVKKVIASVWETIPHSNEGIWGRRAYKERAIRELDHLIAVTERAKSSLISEGVNHHKITVIPPGIDTRRFFPKEGWLHHHAETKRRSFTILFCGRLEREKGVMDLLAAIRRLSLDASLFDYHLRWVFVGDGALRQQIVRETQYFIKNWHSHLMSATYDEMPSIYRQADLFVAPSVITSTWEEQYNIALLEAQATGLPIVTTRTGGIPENVGEAAVCVKPGDVYRLAHAIKEFLVNAKKRLIYARRARLRATSIHDIRISSRKLSELYQHVLSR